MDLKDARNFVANLLSKYTTENFKDAKVRRRFERYFAAALDEMESRGITVGDSLCGELCGIKFVGTSPILVYR